MDQKKIQQYTVEQLTHKFKNIISMPEREPTYFVVGEDNEIKVIIKEEGNQRSYRALKEWIDGPNRATNLPLLTISDLEKEIAQMGGILIRKEEVKRDGE